MKQPIIAPEKRITFAAFKKAALMHKFQQAGFVLLYDKGEYGWNYRIKMYGYTSLKQENALRAAYFLLFINTNDYHKKYVAVDLVNGLKMPLSTRFTSDDSYNCDQWDASMFSTTLREEKEGMFAK